MYSRFSVIKEQAPINKSEVVTSFLNSLKNKDATKIEKLWSKHQTILSHWMSQCKKETAIKCFQLALTNKNSALVNEIWGLNRHIKSWYTHGKPNISIPISDFHRDFNLLLEHDCPEILDVFWRSHLFPHRWFTGGTVNFGSNNKIDNKTISQNEIIKCLRGLLRLKNQRNTEILWNAKKGLLIDFYHENSTHHKLSFAEIMIDFKRAIINGHTECAQELWYANYLLQIWFSGQILSFGELESDLGTASPQEALLLFNKTLQFQNDALALQMWTINPVLRDLFTKDNNMNQITLVAYLQKAEEDNNKITAAAMRSNNELYKFAKNAPGIEYEARKLQKVNAGKELYSFFSSSENAKPRQHTAEIFSLGTVMEQKALI